MKNRTHKIKFEKWNVKTKNTSKYKKYDKNKNLKIKGYKCIINYKKWKMYKIEKGKQMKTKRNKTSKWVTTKKCGKHKMCIGSKF